MQPVEIVAVAFGIVSVWLSTRQNVWSWPTAIVNVLLYVVVFHRAKLYAGMGLQVVYAALSVYGWYQWLYGGEGRTTLPVSRLRPRTALVLAGGAAAVAVALGATLAQRTGAALPYLDSAATATSLAAQWLMTRKVLETWLVWIAVDVVYVGMFLHQSLRLTAGLYAVFLVLAVLGWRDWRRDWRAAHAPTVA